MLQYAESTMIERKRLIGLKFNNPTVQNIIKNWSVKVIEDKKTGKSHYVIKIGRKKIFSWRSFFNDIKLHKNKFRSIWKEIKKVVIGVSAHFNNLQRETIIKSAKKWDLKLLN